VKALSAVISLTLLLSACSSENSSKSSNSSEPLKSGVEISDFTAWSEDVSNELIVAVSQESFRKWAAERRSPTSKHKLVIQPGLASKRIDNLTKVDQLGSEIFSSYFTKPSITVFGSDEKWVVAEFNANQIQEVSCSQDGGGRGGLTYCVRGRGNGYVVTKDAIYQPNSPGYDGTSLLPHEFFHIVQEQMADLEGKPIVVGDPGSAELFPAWFIEGTANFVGFSVAALALNTTYWQGYKAMFNYAPPEESINKNSIADYELRTCCGNNSPTFPYVIGQVATEYLVASVGFQKMLDIFIDFKKTKNFTKSFENAIGISKSDFYAKFDSIRDKLLLPEISWKLICDKNYKISEIPDNPPSCSKPAKSKSNSQNQPPAKNSPPATPRFTPPLVDSNSNIDGLGCSFGASAITNSFGTFACKELANGNNLWQKVD
jgi:hypothetical protein